MGNVTKQKPKKKPVDQVEELCKYLSEKTQACILVAQNSKDNKPRAWLGALLELSILQSKIILALVEERKKK